MTTKHLPAMDDEWLHVASEFENLADVIRTIVDNDERAGPTRAMMSWLSDHERAMIAAAHANVHQRTETHR